MVRLIRVVLGLSLLAGGAALADETAASTQACPKEGCTCSQGPASPCPVHRGKGAGLTRRPAFDAKTVATFRGTVTAVERVAHGEGLVGVHLRVQSGTQTLVVRLGPASFVDPRATFAAKDAIEVRGSKVTFDGEPTVLAMTVKKGGKAVELRRDDGTPLFRLPPS